VRAPTIHRLAVALSSFFHQPAICFPFLSRSHRLAATVAAEKLIRVAGQRIRNYDLSRRRDYLLSLSLDFENSRATPVRTSAVSIPPAGALHADVACWNFLSKSITKANNARYLNVGIHLGKSIGTRERE